MTEMTDKEKLDRLLVLNEYGYCIEISEAKWTEKYKDEGIEFLSDEMLVRWFGHSLPEYVREELDAISLLASSVR